jgi:hypothetical protein
VVANKIIEHSQKDYRRLLFILQDLKLNYKKDISQKIVDEYIVLSKKKDVDVDIYNATASLMMKYQSVDECARIYESEKVIMPLMMDQNYIKCLNTWGTSGKHYELASDIALSIAQGDLIENYIYSDQNWDMQDVHGFFTCVNPSFMMSNAKLNTCEEEVRAQMDFPLDLNKTSIKKINNKNVTNSRGCLKNFEISDFIYANKLIKKLIDDERADECATILKGYGAKVENVESMLKIDKINETKTTLASSVKKKFTQILGSNKPNKNKSVKSKKIKKNTKKE